MQMLSMLENFKEAFNEQSDNRWNLVINNAQWFTLEKKSPKFFMYNTEFWLKCQQAGRRTAIAVESYTKFLSYR